MRHAAIDRRISSLESKIEMIFGAVQSLTKLGFRSAEVIEIDTAIKLPKLPLNEVGEMMGLNDRLLNQLFLEQMVRNLINIFESNFIKFKSIKQCILFIFSRFVS